MGAQAAALLDAGGALGDVPAGGPRGDAPLDDPYDRVLSLAPPAGWDADRDLARTALLHGGVGLAPTAWDGSRLHLRLPSPVVVHPDLTVAWRGTPPPVTVLRRVLDLGTPRELWAACDRVPELAGLRPRVLRSPTVWQDLVGTLAGTRASYRSTQAMVRSLVGDGPFPGPEQVLSLDLSRWGYRAPWLLALAGRVVDGWDPEPLLSLPPDPGGHEPGPPVEPLADDEVQAEVRSLAGFGPFAAAQLMPLLGRPRPLVLDGWLRDQLGGASDAEVLARFAPMGRWAGTGSWLAACAHRLR